MDEEKPKKKRKKAVVADDGAGDHKPNWREVYATVGEIKAYLSDHIHLRWNLVKHRVEARLPMEDPFCANSELTQFVSDDWLPMCDRLLPVLPGPPAAMGRAGLYHGTLRVGERGRWGG